MWKKAGGVVLGGCLLIAVGGYGSGCNGTGTDYAPLDRCAGPSTGYRTYGPSFKDAGRCSEPQLSAFYDNCIGSGATDTKCTAFFDANKSCKDCLFGTDTTTTDFGAYIDIFPNTPGYVAYQGASLACATAYHNVISCSITACKYCGSNAEIDACNTKVIGVGGVCENENAAYAAACTSQSDKDAITRAAAKVSSSAPIADFVGFTRSFCGTPLPGSDAGTDAGDGGTDAGDGGQDAGDASTDAPTDG